MTHTTTTYEIGDPINGYGADYSIDELETATSKFWEIVEDAEYDLEHGACTVDVIPNLQDMDGNPEDFYFLHKVTRTYATINKICEIGEPKIIEKIL